MTNRQLYNELIDIGAPALPDSYYYKFWVDKSKRNLHCAIRKSMWGGLFFKEAVRWYWQRSELSRYSTDVSRLLELGWITADEIDGEYRPAHMALLAVDSYADFLKKETVDKHVTRFLNKKLP